jgi:hypothetical protein
MQWPKFESRVAKTNVLDNAFYLLLNFKSGEMQLGIWGQHLVGKPGSSDPYEKFFSSG